MISMWNRQCSNKETGKLKKSKFCQTEVVRKEQEKRLVQRHGFRGGEAQKGTACSIKAMAREQIHWQIHSLVASGSSSHPNSCIKRKRVFHTALRGYDAWFVFSPIILCELVKRPQIFFLGFLCFGCNGFPLDCDRLWGREFICVISGPWLLAQCVGQ